MSVTAIILAGGNGVRFSSDLPKQFIKLAGKPILEHTVQQFQDNDFIDNVLIVTNPEYIEQTQDIFSSGSFTKLIGIIKGGKTRQESSYNGLKACPKGTKKVLLHDAVRPFVSDTIIKNSVLGLDEVNAIDVAISSADTIIKVDEKSIIEDIPKRKFLRRGQTPQAFNFDFILRIHEQAKSNKDIEVTDDCGLVRYLSNEPIKVVDGEESNIKITYPEDLYLADKLFQVRTINLNKFKTIQLEKELSGKNIVVFGGTSGIGLEISNLAQKFGARVKVFSRSSGINIKNFVEVENALRDACGELGQIDYVINTAAVLKISPLKSKNIDEISEEISINFTGNVNVVKASHSYLQQSKGGILLFTSSSYTRGRANYSLYSSTKAAVVNLVQAMSEELAEESIRINVINPERTKTPMRTAAFGEEPEGSLLCPVVAAEVSLKTLVSELTGQVVDVRR